MRYSFVLLKNKATLLITSFLVQYHHYSIFVLIYNFSNAFNSCNIALSLCVATLPIRYSPCSQHLPHSSRVPLKLSLLNYLMVVIDGQTTCESPKPRSYGFSISQHLAFLNSSGNIRCK